ncbi:MULTISPECIES: GlcG/HbpS family heme-binding protein [Photorhabdus]|uniref:GlcG/HbpS family heme-binding protein n=1 Tax=Photorhabdus TaxID=29487 RepID=UPI00052C2987|nr:MULTISPECIES: heme-binding protein [Photorhabdus]KGM26932.1 GlcG [Photorhabdus luminescens]MBS9430593.1 heme-binding protein [Photorhabdus akhurstii]MCC8456462.1 heme-binding protein [Photorhabdus aegyptia]PQQ42261.1 heme-binding protein [Photorhabdus luminescens]
MKHSLFYTVLAAGLFAQSAFASSLITERNITLEVANKLASEAVQSCQSNNYNVTVSVIDKSGVLKAVQRMDKAGLHTVEASKMKAYTALSTQRTSEDVMKTAQSNLGAQYLGDIPGFLLLGGGVPVKSGDEVIGAIGIGGAPSGSLDQQCALDAIQKISSDLS